MRALAMPNWCNFSLGFPVNRELGCEFDLRKSSALFHTARKRMKHVDPAAAVTAQFRSAEALEDSKAEHRVGRSETGTSRRAFRAVRGRMERIHAVRLREESESQQRPQLRSPRKLGLLSLIAATFFVVSGGPYGLEEIVSGHGYLHTLLLLLIVPLVWSLPIALLVGEMSSTLPQEGGYYAWVRRAMGPFWGMQVAWLALAMSLFDMAIYPTLLVTYLGRLFPAFQDTSVGGVGWLAGVIMIALCTLWNLRGSCAVGQGSIVLGAALLVPFLAMIGGALLQFFHTGFSSVSALLMEPPPGQSGGSLWVAGVLVCMWNYMGWDNASTVAADVERPQKTYPRAMALTVLLVAGCYVIPVLFALASGLPASQWSAGAWVEVGRRLGGPFLGFAIAIGGALCGLGMFNMLVLAYSRLPLALAQDGLLPRWLAVRSRQGGAPTRIVLLSALLYAACMGLGFRRLVEIDVILYGAAITLQFGALFVLRRREPNLVRPFRIPGGVLGLVLLAALPIGLLGLALWAGRHEPGMWGLSSLELGVVITLCGPILYGLRMALKWLLRPAPTAAQPTSVSEADTAEHAAISIL